MKWFKNDPKKGRRGGPKWPTNKHVCSRGGAEKGPQKGQPKKFRYARPAAGRSEGIGSEKQPAEAKNKQN